jgi:acyl-CoA synthetase (AMP-forming)/AMP-acid ligase II
MLRRRRLFSHGVQPAAGWSRCPRAADEIWVPRHPPSDASGCVTINACLKQLVKYKGHQVAPSELDAILLTHPQVLDAVAVGVPNEVACEVPKAFVAAWHRTRRSD